MSSPKRASSLSTVLLISVVVVAVFAGAFYISANQRVGAPNAATSSQPMTSSSSSIANETHFSVTTSQNNSLTLIACT
jgi:hypothetical protein